MFFQLLTTLSILFVCLREIFVKDTNIHQGILLFQIFLGLMSSVVGFGGGLMIMIKGPEGVAVWDNSMIVEAEIKKRLD